MAAAASNTRILLLALLLLLAAACCIAQSTPPSITEFLGDELLRVNLTVNTSVLIQCPAKQGFQCISNRDNSEVIAEQPRINIDLSYTKGSFDSISDLRSRKMGAYHCLYRVGDGVQAYAFILSEKPRQIPSSNRFAMQTSGSLSKFEPTCSVATDDVVWERYVDNEGLFTRISSSGASLSLDYTELQRDQSGGFTIYRCYSRSQPELVNYYEAAKAKDLQIRTFQTSNYTSTLLPKIVTPGVEISLECHGRRMATSVRPDFFFKQSKAKEFTKIVCNVEEISCIQEKVQTQLKISPFQPKNAGDYYCVKDNVIQRARLVGNLGNVLIKEYTKGIYPIGTENRIRCKASQIALAPNMFYVLYRVGKPSIELRNGSSIDGYTASLDSENQLVLQFPMKQEADNATLECRLHFSKDYTTLRLDLPKLNLTLTTADTTYKTFLCKKDKVNAEGLMGVYILNSNGTLGKQLDSYITPEGFAAYEMDGGSKFAQYVCTMNYKGMQLRSNVLHFGKPDVTVDIIVAGDKNPAAKVFLEGRDINIECQFANLPYDMELAPDRVRLQKNSSSLSLARSAINSSLFRFVLLRAKPDDSGFYRCHYGEISLLRATPLGGTFRSNNSMISICNSSQFVCDSMCKDRSLLCDKKADCADKTDELPEVCSKCEPNSVLCKERNGKQPQKRCVLKHWLCDGQDDCGNGFDEDIDIHQKWCFKEPSCKKCQQNETCCPGISSSKCILRAYECDKETDCEGDMNDEKMCSSSDCLKLKEPTERKIIEKKVGESLNLTCKADGGERPTINWRRNWAAVPKQNVTELNSVVSRHPITGMYTVEGKLVIANVTKAIAGIYNCEAINNCKRILSHEIEIKVSD